MPSITERDHNADTAIGVMITAVIGTAALPAHVNWSITATAMGAGVIAIGKCYDVKLQKDEAWKLVKQFFIAAGGWFLAMNVGSKLLAALVESTGIGYAGGVALDAAVSAAAAYAIGHTAKEFFRRDYLGQRKLSDSELGEIFREAFKKKKKSA